MMTVDEFLMKLNACEEAVLWSKSIRTFEDLWRECSHIEWMLWMFQQLGYENQPKLRLCATSCVRRFWNLLIDPRSRQAVEIAEQFTVNAATSAQLRTARQNARAAMDDVAVIPQWSASVAIAATAAYHTTRASAVEAARHSTSHCLRVAVWHWNAETASQREELWQIGVLREMVEPDFPVLVKLAYEKIELIEGCRGSA